MFKRIMSKFSKPPATSTLPQPIGSSDSVLTSGPDEIWDEAYADRSAECRQRFWSDLGNVDPDVIAYVINPSFMGEAQWPGLTQRYRVIRRANSVIITSDGLSDPFSGAQGAGNGFENEFFIETSDIPEAFLGRHGNVADLGNSWAFPILASVCRTVAGVGGIADRLKSLGVLSMEIPGAENESRIYDQLPKHFIAEGNRLGVLIGAPKPDFDCTMIGMPLTEVVAVPIVLLTAAELVEAEQGGAEARRAVASRLEISGVGHRSQFKRPL